MRELRVHEEMLFALLRASLHRKETETDFFKDVLADDWKECYLLACRQGVMALAWDGVMKLPVGMMPPKALKITWGMAVDACEKQYERYCRTVDELTKFYMSKGIVAVLLKGVGFSTCYPYPSHREGGDIDIYTYSHNKNEMTDSEANRLADKLMEEQGIEVNMNSPKHSNFYYKGIPVENHKTFLDIGWYRVAGQTDMLLRKMMEPQFTYLMGGKYKCLTPPDKFNALFLPFHAAMHYGSGLALHHLCDWVMILSLSGGTFPEEVADWKFRKAVNAFTCLCNRYLGTSGTANQEVENFAEEILEEILHPKFVKDYIPVKGKWNVLKYKLRRFCYVYRLNNQMLEWLKWKRICEIIVNLCRAGK